MTKPLNLWSLMIACVVSIRIEMNFGHIKLGTHLVPEVEKSCVRKRYHTVIKTVTNAIGFPSPLEFPQL
jgi:hypothetical protein